MRKAPSISLDVPPAARPRRRGELALTLLLALMLTPIAYESAASCVARWQSMVGPTVTVDTPILDAVNETFSRGIYVFRYQLVSTFNNTPWRPSVVIGCGLAFAALASVPLRRAH